jgi:hypothetical protein
MALFLLRHADHRILPVYCYRPQGAQVFLFLDWTWNILEKIERNVIEDIGNVESGKE